MFWNKQVKKVINKQDVRNKLKDIQDLINSSNILFLSYEISEYQAIAKITINYKCEQWLDIKYTPAILSDYVINVFYDAFKDYKIKYNVTKSTFTIRR